MSAGFCPSTWEVCFRDCPAGTCLAHDLSRCGPDPEEFEVWRDAMERDLLLTLLLPPPLPPQRRASTDEEPAGGTLPS